MELYYPSHIVNIIYLQALIHELEVHQIELELQSDELLQALELSDVATKKYIELYDFAPLGYVTLSGKGEIINLNLCGANILGKERSSLKNSLFGFFVTDDTKPIFNLFLGKVFISKITETCEVTLAVRGYEPKHVQLNGIAIEEGEQCLLTMTDFTERKLAEEALGVSENRYRRLFETAKDGILILDGQTERITDVNPSLIEMLGYRKEQLIDRTLWEMGFFKYIPDNHNEFVELQQKKYISYENLLLETADGRQINVEFVCNVYLVDHHKVIQCNVRDTTERKLIQDALETSEAKLKELNATKDKFFSIIAHDLRGPFNGILGFSDILKEEAAEMNFPKIQEYAEMVNSSALQVFRLLDNLLSWARIQQGQMLFYPSAITLKYVINEVIGLFVENANNKNITLTQHIPDELMITADSDMLKLIIRNLISNAIKFTPTNGIIELYAVEDNTQVEVSVSDNGKGIARENIDKLFKIDTIFTTRGTENEKGTGLGLILCKEFVEKHGGKIWAESEPYKGSIFKFSIPK